MPRHFERSVEISAPPSRVWFVLTDVEAMPSWNPAMTSVTLDPAGPLAVGSVARIVQPKLSPTQWTVTDLVPGESFTWRSRAVGTTSTAGHVLEAAPGGGTTVHLTLDYAGVGSLVTAFFAETLTRDYLKLEAEGLKEACEAGRREQRRSGRGSR